MSSPVIPKEHLSAYQRWEMASFGEDRPSLIPPPVPQGPSPEEVMAEAQQALEEARLLREQAREEGYAQGYAEGREQGHAEGLKAGQDEGRAGAARAASQLWKIADTFGKEVARADDAMAEDMLNLALDLAKAMLKSALKAKPELMLPVVQEAIRYLPTVQQPAVLVMHPQDAELARSHLAAELSAGGWRLSEDPQMEPGGCRIETASNQIDATPQVRWQRIAEALGRQSDWLE